MFYAKFSPRGFSNEYDILAFTTRALRDQFCAAVPRTSYSEYYRALIYTDNQSARAYAVTAREVAEITREDRKHGYRLDGSWVRFASGSDSLSLAEYFNGAEVIEALDERGHIIRPGDGCDTAPWTPAEHAEYLAG